MKAAEARLAQARYEAERARKRLVTTAGALQYRLRPATIVSQAKEGVVEKSRELAEDAIQAVKDRPAAVSGVVAAITLFLARGPIWSAILSLRDGRDGDDDIVTADLGSTDENYDLTAPAVDRTEGANA